MCYDWLLLGELFMKCKDKHRFICKIVCAKFSSYSFK